MVDWEREGRTVVHFLDHVFDFLGRFDVWDYDTGCAGVEGGGERELVVLGDADDY